MKEASKATDKGSELVIKSVKNGFIIRNGFDESIASTSAELATLVEEWAEDLERQDQ